MYRASRKSQLVRAIVFAEDTGLILLEKAGSSQHYRLPFLQLELGANAKGELKSELEAEFAIKLRFRKILPDSWTKNFRPKQGEGVTNQFELTYIFELLGFDKLRFKQTEAIWVEPDKDTLSHLTDSDAEALTMFID